jgi:hypothetical protein
MFISIFYIIFFRQIKFILKKKKNILKKVLKFFFNLLINIF